MFKKEKLKDLAPIAIPHGPPVEAVDEYFKSKMESGNMVKLVCLIHYYRSWRKLRLVDALQTGGNKGFQWRGIGEQIRVVRGGV